MSARKQLWNGKNASNRSKMPSKDRTTSEKNLERLLAATYGQYQRKEPSALNAQCKQDFIFHMLDWTHGLEKLTELYRHPERFTKADTGKIVSGFLYHVILRAAGRLLLDYEPEDFFAKLETQTRERQSRHITRHAR